MRSTFETSGWIVSILTQEFSELADGEQDWSGMGRAARFERDEV